MVERRGEFMNKYQIQLSDLNIEINSHNSFENEFKKYAISGCKPDIVISATDEGFDELIAHFGSVSQRHAEFIALYYLLSQKLLKFQRMVFHASVLEVDSRGYAFSAISGVGKTTQTRLWLKYFKDRARVINGDKPILSFDGDTAYAWGTPWCGKEGIGINASVPLRAVFFIERAEENSIERLESSDILKKMFFQFFMPKAGGVGMSELLLLANRLVKCVPMYLLKCNMDISAVEVAYKKVLSDM